MVAACPVVLVAAASLASLSPEQAPSAKMKASSSAKRGPGDLPAPWCDRLPVSGVLTVLPSVRRDLDMRSCPVTRLSLLAADQRRRILHRWDDPGKSPVSPHEFSAHLCSLPVLPPGPPPAAPRPAVLPPAPRLGPPPPPPPGRAGGLAPPGGRLPPPGGRGGVGWGSVPLPAFSGVLRSWFSPLPWVPGGLRAFPRSLGGGGPGGGRPGRPRWRLWGRWGWVGPPAPPPASPPASRGRQRHGGPAHVGDAPAL